jgi:hypothetical protein
MHISKFDPRLDELLKSEEVVLRSDSGAIVASEEDLHNCECSFLQVSFKEWFKNYQIFLSQA